MAGFVAPILQGLVALEDHKKQVAAQEQQRQEQVKQNLQEILIQKLMEREGGF